MLLLAISLVLALAIYGLHDVSMDGLCEMFRFAYSEKEWEKYESYIEQ